MNEVRVVSSDNLAPKAAASKVTVILANKARFHDTYAPNDKDEREAHRQQKALDK